MASPAASPAATLSQMRFTPWISDAIQGIFDLPGEHLAHMHNWLRLLLDNHYSYVRWSNFSHLQGSQSHFLFPTLATQADWYLCLLASCRLTPRPCWERGVKIAPHTLDLARSTHMHWSAAQFEVTRVRRVNSFAADKKGFPSVYILLFCGVRRTLTPRT